MAAPVLGLCFPAVMERKANRGMSRMLVNQA
jgi:hypothetical protein